MPRTNPPPATAAGRAQGGFTLMELLVSLTLSITALGLATEPALREMASAWRAWGADPGAFWARFWCH